MRFMHLHKLILLSLAMVAAPWSAIHAPVLGQETATISRQANTNTSPQSFTEVQKNSLQLVESMMRDVATLDLKKTPPMTFIEKYGTFWSKSNARHLEPNSWPLGQDICRKPPDPSGVDPCPEVDLRQWHFHPRRKTFFSSVRFAAHYLSDEKQMLVKTVFYSNSNSPDKLTVKSMKKWFGDVFSPGIEGGGEVFTTLKPWRAEKYQLRNFQNQPFKLEFYATWDDPAKGENNTLGFIKFEYTFNKI
jgi:hypothetical protein